MQYVKHFKYPNFHHIRKSIRRLQKIFIQRNKSREKKTRNERKESTLRNTCIDSFHSERIQNCEIHLIRNVKMNESRRSIC